MPIYEYSCSKCGKTIEVIQKFSDPVLKKHQGCGGALTKLISASGFQFKGSGWYVTDYARKGNSGDSEAKETTEKKESSAKAETSNKETSGKESSGKESSGKESSGKESSSKESSKKAPSKSGKSSD